MVKINFHDLTSDEWWILDMVRTNGESFDGSWPTICENESPSDIHDW